MTIRVDAGPDSDELETAELTQQLRRRLLDQGVERADPVSESVTPPGARAVDAVTMGSLLLVVAPGTIAGVVEVFKFWLDRRHGRAIEVSVGDRSVKLTGGTAAEIQQVLDTLTTVPKK